MEGSGLLKENAELLFDGDVNYEDLSVRLYADLTSSTLLSQKNKDAPLSLESRIILDLTEVIAAANSKVSLEVLCRNDVHTLICSILSLNINESPRICSLGILALTRLCRYGFSISTQSNDNTKLIARKSVCKICIEALNIHPNSRDLFLNCLDFFACILISKDILQMLSECGLEAMVTTCLHLYVLESDVVTLCANLIVKAVTFDADISVRFGRRGCCEMLVMALRKNDDHDRMCLSICDAMLSLYVSGENRSKLRAAGARTSVSIMSSKRDERSFEILQKSQNLLTSL